MSYSADLATLVANQLTRFLKIDRHQLAQQAANMDFWLEQARNSLAAIDGYQNRLQNMQTVHESIVGSLTLDFELERKFKPPQKVPDNELQSARRELAKAVFEFVERCVAENLIPAARAQDGYDRLGIVFEARMMRSRQT